MPDNFHAPTVLVVPNPADPVWVETKTHYTVIFNFVVKFRIFNNQFIGPIVKRWVEIESEDSEECEK